MFKRITRLPQMLIAFCLLLTAAYGQSSTATLSGTVQDEHGAVIPDAAVTMHNRATSLKRTATTNDSGSFSIPLLPPGEYTVLVEREGFTRVQLTNIVLNVGDQKAVQVQLKVGDVASTVEVRPDEALINTSPAVTSTIDRNFAATLPLNGRSFQSLILLTPGATVVPATANSPGQFSVNGQRATSNYFTVDGVSANTGTFNYGTVNTGIQSLSGNVPGMTALGGTNGLVSVDALEEFKIQTSTYGAEFGRQPGGQISLVTRRGGNQFHGSVFEYLRNEKLDANDWFANAAGRGRSPLRQNQLGGVFSGPVLLPRFGDGGPRLYNGRNRTFFFFSYEGMRLVLPQAKVSTVPSLRLRALAAPVLQPVLAAFPLPDGPEQLNSAGQPTGFSPFTGVYSDASTLDSTGIRIDHTVNDKLTLFGRYSNAPSSSTSRSGSFPLSSYSEVEITSRSLTLGATLAVTSGLSNELRFNISTDKVAGNIFLTDFGGAVPLDLLAATIPDLASKGPVVVSQFFLIFPGGAIVLPMGRGFANHDQQQLNLVDNLSWVKGSHLFKLGIDYRKLAPTYMPVNYQQQSIFNSEARVQSGIASNVSTLAMEEVRPRFSNISTYAQDTWRLLPKLTFDLGVRWEINPGPGEAGGKKPLVVIGMDNLPTATLAPPGTPLYKTEYLAFAPRVGAAYQLSDAKGWERVIRGGFGVFYDTGSGLAAQGYQSFPFRRTTSLTNVSFPISPALAVVPPLPAIRLPITSTVLAIDPELDLPYTLQWNLSVQQSLGPNQTVSASYVAAAGRRLTMQSNFNDRNTAAQPRQNPNFALINYLRNGPTSDYHSLQLQFQRRLTKGLQAMVNYTWAHAIDEASDEAAANSSVLDRANASFDIRHNFSGAVTYNLPGQSVKGLIGMLIRNWSVNGIVRAQSAFPVNITGGSFALEDGTTVFRRPDLVAGQPLYIDDPNVPGGRRFNSAAFRNPPVGSNGIPLRNGTFGRNVLRGLPIHQVDIGLRRQFDLTEKVKLQFSGEAFNLLNHPNFGGFGTNFSSLATFGVPTQMLGRSLGGLSALYQIGGPRSLQFALRLSF